MKLRTWSRKAASIGSNQSSRSRVPVSASDCETGGFVLSFVMAWSPPARERRIVAVSTPGDYATFNSNHTPDGTPWVMLNLSRSMPASGLKAEPVARRQFEQ